MRQSSAIVLKDKQLMILPILSFLTILVVCASFIVPIVARADSTSVSHGLRHEYRFGLNVHTGVMFALYVVAYTVSIFFQCAVVAGATQRLDGGKPTLSSALAAASRRFPTILAWGVVAATLGVALRAVSERSGLLGKIVIAFVGAAWSLATYFVVPVLVFEERTMGDTFKRSLQIVRKQWGETVIGGGGIGLAALLYWLPMIAVVALLFIAGWTIGAVVVAAIGTTAGLAFFGTLQSVYLASLYRYATVGEAPAGFQGDDLAAAFRRK